MLFQSQTKMSRTSPSYVPFCYSSTIFYVSLSNLILWKVRKLHCEETKRKEYGQSCPTEQRRLMIYSFETWAPGRSTCYTAGSIPVVNLAMCKLKPLFLKYLILFCAVSSWFVTVDISASRSLIICRAFKHRAVFKPVYMKNGWTSLCHFTPLPTFASKPWSPPQ